MSRPAPHAVIILTLLLFMPYSVAGIAGWGAFPLYATEKATIATPDVPDAKPAVSPAFHQVPQVVEPLGAPPVGTLPPQGHDAAGPPAVTAESSPAVVRLKSTFAPDRSYRNAVLAEDTVLLGNVLVTGWMTVPPQVTLTIAAGTVLRFTPEADTGSATSGLFIQGRLIASGEPGRPVLLTGGYATPQAGDWQGVVLLASDKKNVLEQIRIEGAAVALDLLHSQLTLEDFTIAESGTGIRLRDTYATMIRGELSRNGIGISADDSELDLRELDLSGNDRGMTVKGGSLFLTGSKLSSNSSGALSAARARLKVSGCSISGNGDGAIITDADGTLSLNRILDNRTAGIVLEQSRLKLTGNTVSRNGVGVTVAEGNSTLWGNVLSENSSYDLQYAGGSDLAAMGNWWGAPEPERILPRIHAGDAPGKVLIMPVLLQRPERAP